MNAFEAVVAVRLEFGDCTITVGPLPLLILAFILFRREKRKSAKAKKKSRLSRLLAEIQKWIL